MGPQEFIRFKEHWSKNDDNLIKSALNFLISCQNSDGGFGENPDYFDVNQAGKVSHPFNESTWVIRSLLDWLPMII